jgi:hypothetical protein
VCGKYYILPHIDKQNSRIASEAGRWKSFVSTVSVAAFTHSLLSLLLYTANHTITKPVTVMDTVLLFAGFS